jgi:hypothetical protein
MKRSFLNLLIRIIRLLKMEGKLMPELKTLERKDIRVGRLYNHYGRVVYAHPNPEQVNIEYENEFGSVISEQEYNRLADEGKPCNIRKVSGKACSKCDFERLGLPCRCDFASGRFTGYYEVLQTRKQYSTNLIKPKIRIR